jgi:uridine kinase
MRKQLMTDNLKKEIAVAEAAYRAQVEAVAEMLMADKEKRYVLISGGSGAGKTTTTKILEESLLSKGRYVSKISLDDFYRDDLYNEDGTFRVDVEAPDALDLPYLRECFAKLEHGEIAKIPYFSFKTKRRTEDYTEIKMREGEVCIIEGLHALNPQIYGKEVERKRLLKVFLHPIPQNVEGLTEPRLLRRMIRDYYHRNAPATLTFSMWDGVKAGEEKYILPFVPDADFVINTFFSYETGALKGEGMKILSEVPTDSVYYERALALMGELEKFPVYGTDVIPEDSLLNEFTE